MQEESYESWNILNKYKAPAIVLILVFASFYLGVLTAKVSIYGKQLGGVNGNSENSGTAAAKQPLGGSPNKRSPNNNLAAPAPSKDIKVDPISATDHIRGNKNARIALIEYSDLECPFCKRFHPTAQQVLDTYKDKVVWVYRSFPMSQLHSKAKKESEAIECAGKLAGNEGFWKMTDKIFEVTPSNNGLDLTILPDLASSVGIDKTAFKSCLDSGEMAAKVDAQYQSGLNAGVKGTPGNFLLDTKTGKAVEIPGAVPFESIKQVIDQMLAQ
jgi:protein-disulfide isomerase